MYELTLLVLYELRELQGSSDIVRSRVSQLNSVAFLISSEEAAPSG